MLQTTQKILIITILCCFAGAQAQFWKMNARSNKDLFILETKANMPSGICYKLTPRQSNDPELRMQTISYCCDGYRQSKTTTLIKCEPICTEDCSNGICTEPDICECYPGYLRAGGRCEEQ